MLPDAGESTRSRERVLEISSVCDLSRDPDLLRGMGRGADVRPLVVACRLSNDTDRSRERADSAL